VKPGSNNSAEIIHLKAMVPSLKAPSSRPPRGGQLPQLDGTRVTDMCNGLTPAQREATSRKNFSNPSWTVEIVFGNQDMGLSIELIKEFLSKAGITIYLSYNNATTYFVSVNHPSRGGLRTKLETALNLSGFRVASIQ